MQVVVNKITGYEDAIASMFFSKQRMDPEFYKEITRVVEYCTERNGQVKKLNPEIDADMKQFTDWMNKLCGWGWQHITLLKFVDISSCVYGLHRAGQDDWDAHAERYDNRIIRNSTRMSAFDGAVSTYYEDKIMSTDKALATLKIEVPDEIELDGVKYVKTLNGYIREDMKDVQDVKRGLYMLSIPSSFIFKVNVTQYAHVYKERNKDGHAHPEVKETAERLADILEDMCPWFTRELFMKIKN